MPFVKGHKLGRGRPPSAKNVKTLEALSRIDKVLNLLDTTIEQDIKAMKPSDRARIYIDLQEYKMPKLSRVGELTKPTQEEIFSDKQALEILKLNDGE
mgnify:CR=1 FL=1